MAPRKKTQKPSENQQSQANAYTKELEKDMPQFLQTLVLEHPEICEAISEQFLILSSLLCIKDYYTSMEDRGFTYFKNINMPELLNHIGEFVLEIQSQFSAAANTTDPQDIEFLEFLQHVDIKLAMETLGLPQGTSTPAYATEHNAIYERNLVQSNKLLLSSNNNERQESLDKIRSPITTDKINANLTKAALLYVQNQHSTKPKLPKLYFSACLEIANNCFKASETNLVPNQEPEFKQREPQSQKAWESYHQASLTNQYALRCCMAVYLIQPAEFASFAAQHQNSALLQYFKQEIQPFLEKDISSKIYFGHAARRGAVAGDGAAQNTLAILQNLTDDNAKTCQQSLEVFLKHTGDIFDFFALSILVCFKYQANLDLLSADCAVNGNTFNKALFIANAELGPLNLVRRAMGNALVQFNLPSDPELLVNQKASDFEKICENTLFSKEDKDGFRDQLSNMQRLPELKKLRKNFEDNCPSEDTTLDAATLATQALNKDQSQKAPTELWSKDDQEVIQFFLEQVARRAAENYEYASKKLCTLGWNKLKPLFEPENQPKNASSKGTNQSLLHATIQCIRDYCYNKSRITENSELNKILSNLGDPEAMQELGATKIDPNADASSVDNFNTSTLNSDAQPNTTLIEALSKIKSKGKPDKKDLDEDSLEEIRTFFINAKNAGLLTPNDKIYNIFRRLVFDDTTKSSDLFAGLYGALLNADSLDQVELNYTLKADQFRGIQNGSDTTSLQTLQLFCILYGPTLRQLCQSFTQFKVSFTLLLGSKHHHWVLDPKSDQELENQSFALVDFKAFLSTPEISRLSGTATDSNGKVKGKGKGEQKKDNASQLEFTLRYADNEEQSKSSEFQLFWMVQADSIGLPMVDMLDKLLDPEQKRDAALGSHDAATASASTPAPAELGADSETADAATLLAELMAYAPLFQPIKIVKPSSNTIISLHNKWDKGDNPQECCHLEQCSEPEPRVEYLDQVGTNQQAATSSSPMSFLQILQQDKNLPNYQLVLQAALDFARIYGDTLYSLYHGALTSNSVQQCVSSYFDLLNAIKSNIRNKADRQQYLCALLNLGTAFVEQSYNDQEWAAVSFPWHVLGLHGLLLKQQQWINCFAQLLGGEPQKQDQLKLFGRSKILEQSARLLSEQSYGPTILLVLPHKTGQKQLNPVQLSSQEQLYGCNLMLDVQPTSNQVKEHDLSDKKHATEIFDILEQHYLPYFAQFKSELNILLYECPSISLILEVFKQLDEAVKNSNEHKLFAPFKINLFVMYQDNGSAKHQDKLRKVYHSIFSKLSQDLQQTTFSLSNNQDFKQSVQLIVLSKDSLNNLVNMDNHDQPRAFFDVTLMFDLSQQYTKFDRSKHASSFGKPSDNDMEQQPMDVSMLEPQYLPALSNPVMLQCNNNEIEWFKYLLTPSTSGDLKQYWGYIYELVSGSSKECLPVQTIKVDDLKKQLRWSHELSKMVICLDQMLFKSNLKSALTDNEQTQKFALIFHQYSKVLQRNILISSCSSTIDPDLNFNLEQELHKLNENLCHNQPDLVKRLFEQAASLSGSIILHSQSNSNTAKELIGLAISSHILQQLCKQEQEELEQNDAENMCHGQLMLDEHLNGLFHEQYADIGLFHAHEQHADILGINVYRNAENDRQPYTIRLYVVESKFMSHNQSDRRKKAAEQVTATCRILSLLQNKAQALAAGNSNYQLSFTEQLALNWLREKLIYAVEQQFMLSTGNVTVSEDENWLVELQDCLFKGMVEIEIYAMAIICNIAKESTTVELDGASGYQSIVGRQGSVAKLILGQQDMVDLLYQIGAGQSTEQPLSFLDDTERQAFLAKLKRS